MCPYDQFITKTSGARKGKPLHAGGLHFWTDLGWMFFNARSNFNLFADIQMADISNLTFHCVACTGRHLLWYFDSSVKEWQQVLENMPCKIPFPGLLCNQPQKHKKHQARMYTCKLHNKTSLVERHAGTFVFFPLLFFLNSLWVVNPTMWWEGGGKTQVQFVPKRHPTL